MSVNVLVIPMTHEILDWFQHKRMLLPEADTAYTPEELAGSATIRQKEGLLVSPAYFQIWISAMLIKAASVYTFWNKDKTICRLWIGDNFYREQLRYGNRSLEHALREMLDKYMKTTEDPERPFFFGYLCSQHDEDQNAFCVLYAVPVRAAALKKNAYITARWMTVAELKKVYRKLDPWSKRIFDYIYEHPPVRKKLKLYQKDV